MRPKLPKYFKKEYYLSSREFLKKEVKELTKGTSPAIEVTEITRSCVHGLCNLAIKQEPHPIKGKKIDREMKFICSNVANCLLLQRTPEETDEHTGFIHDNNDENAHKCPLEKKHPDVNVIPQL